MFIKHLLFIVSLILAFSTSAQLPDADAFFKGTYDKTFVRKHKIKQVFVDIRINGKNSTFYIFQFDTNGLLITQTILDSAKNKRSVYTFKYNNYGDQIERTNIAYDLNKTYKVTFTKTYDSSHLVSEKSSEFPFVTEYSYNSKGQIKETSTLIGGDSLNNSKRISIYNYDSTGNLGTKKDLLVNSNGSTNILETTTFNYDVNGRIVSVCRESAPAYYISYYSSGLLKSKRIKMPEELGNLEIIDNYSYTFWK